MAVVPRATQSVVILEPVTLYLVQVRLDACKVPLSGWVQNGAWHWRRKGQRWASFERSKDKMPITSGVVERLTFINVTRAKLRGDYNEVIAWAQAHRSEAITVEIPE